MIVLESMASDTVSRRAERLLGSIVSEGWGRARERPTAWPPNLVH